MNFHNIFVHVAKFITIRCILSLGVAVDWEIHKMDIKRLFLMEYWRWSFTWINQRVLYKRRRSLVYKLKKNLYGLKQSLRVWYYPIDSFFIKEGFCENQMDDSLYAKQTGEYLSVTILYVKIWSYWHNVSLTICLKTIVWFGSTHLEECDPKFKYHVRIMITMDNIPWILKTFSWTYRLYQKSLFLPLVCNRLPRLINPYSHICYDNQIASQEDSW